MAHIAGQLARSAGLWAWLLWVGCQGPPAPCPGDGCDDGVSPAAPTCVDGARNGHETDVDCGGECGPCFAGSPCASPDDCLSRVCAGSPATCTDPTCFDGVINDGEPDVDCGGQCQTPCEAGQGCAASGDCASGICASGRCAGAQ